MSVNKVLSSNVNTATPHLNAMEQYLVS